MAASKKDTGKKEGPNYVHQNAILCETIKKEQRNQKIYTEYNINQFKKMETLAGKPNSKYDSAFGLGEVDSTFLELFKKSNQIPVEKYPEPQTEAQAIGWYSKPLIDVDKSDSRLYFARRNTEITKYMDAAWRQMEQQQNMN